MAPSPPILTFLSDFGTRDYYVAAVKGVILSRAPRTVLVDVSHEVAPGGVEEGAFLLAAALPSFPPGAVHLAVVDPGVGSARRELAVEAVLAGHDAPSFLVGPDNGLFEPFLDSCRRVVAIDRTDLYRAAPGATFHGRDRFAPVAAAILNGLPLGELGRPLGDPVRGPSQVPRPWRHSERQGVDGRIVQVDRYGNLVSNLPAAALPCRPPTSELAVAIAGRTVDRGVLCYAEISPNEAAWLVGSLGTVELSLRGASLAEAWSIGRGENLSISWSSARI